VGQSRLFRLDWKDEHGRPDCLYLRIGNTARLFRYSTKEEATWQVDGPESQSWPLRLLDPYFQRTRLVCGGATPSQVLHDYHTRLVKEDEFYAYLDLKPRLPADRKDVQLVRIALDKKTSTPRLVQFIEPNGNYTKWDIREFKTNLKPPPTAETLSKDLPPFARKP
jgi:hypothetical protein